MKAVLRSFEVSLTTLFSKRLCNYIELKHLKAEEWLVCMELCRIDQH